MFSERWLPCPLVHFSCLCLLVNYERVLYIRMCHASIHALADLLYISPGWWRCECLTAVRGKLECGIVINTIVQDGGVRELGFELPNHQVNKRITGLSFMAFLVLIIQYYIVVDNGPPTIRLCNKTSKC
ncbi:hypothetical protein BU17DRAFT_71027 [Hysterangium stoloniferum]|nr:hypothetical protein BU17DRAFT_71027 [Hysterangium stoloniferum]